MTALAEIQSALAEFYAQTSSQQRLAQLQQSLTYFEKQPSSWISAIQFLSLSSDQYVCMFSLGIIESTVKLRWTLLSSSEKQQIFQFLERYAFSDHEQNRNFSLVSVVRCKAVKIWTSICKNNFSELHIQFFSRILSLLSFPNSLTTESELQSLLLSFFLFKTAYEELICRDPEISQAKASENASIFNLSVPQILATLFDVTERLLGLEIVNSANSLFTQPHGSATESQFLASLHLIFCLVANLLFSSSSSNSDEKKRFSIVLLKNFVSILECLTLILTVSPATDFDNCRLYSLLYIFVVLGSPQTLSVLLDSSRSRNLSPNIPVESLAEIGMHSLNCLTEVVERKDIPRNVLVHHLPFIFRCLYWSMLIFDTQFPLSDLAASVVNLMAESGIMLSTSQSVNNLSGLASVTQTLESVSEEFYQKMVDVLRPLVTVFFLFTRSANTEQHELDGQSDSFYSFSPTKFLQRVQFFTFSVCRPIISVYLSTLDLWNSYLDFVKAYYVNTSASQKQVQIPPQNQQIISDLCSSLLKTIYFSESAAYLDVLDIEYASSALDVEEQSASYLAFFDDILQHADSSDIIPDGDSEYGGFMQSSLTLLSNIAYFNPTVVLHSVAAKFQEEMATFSQLCNAPERTKLEEHATRKLHYALRDLATCLNSLAYLSDHFGALPNSDMLRWLLQALVFNLSAGVTYCDRLKCLQVETLQQDVVQVIIENINLLRCLLFSGLLLVSSVDITEVPQGHISLSIDDKNAFTTALLQCIHHLLISPIASLRINAALLFQAIVVAATPPGFFPPANQLSEGSPLADLISCCCEPTRLKAFSIQVQRLLMRTVTAYLLIDESAVSNPGNANSQQAEQLQALMSQKTGIFVNRLMSVFNQAITLDTLNSNRDAYFAGLCWLNEALASLVPLGPKSRHLMYDTLNECGLLDRIWKCFETTSLSSEVYLFIAHLSFFVQFTDIYGSQRATASMIPGFVGIVMQLLKVLERNTATARLVSPVISHLLHLLDRLIQNRTAFPPLALEVLRFISNCLVVNLAGESISDLPTTIASASKNDSDLCLRVFRTLFSTFSCAFNQLANHEEHLATFLRPVLAVFAGKVLDPRLLIACSELMSDLNTRHRFFSLSAFLTQWRSQFAQRWLKLLVDGSSIAVQRGSEAETVIIGILHSVYCTSDGFSSKEFFESAVEPFLTEVEQKERVASQLMAALIEKSPTDLAVLDEFNATMVDFLTDIRQNLRTLGNCGGVN